MNVTKQIQQVRNRLAELTPSYRKIREIQLLTAEFKQQSLENKTAFAIWKEYHQLIDRLESLENEKV